MIEIKVDDKEVRGLLNKLQARVKDMSPAMRSISRIMLDAVEENFEKEGRPKWLGLSPSTIAQRKKEGRWPGKILQKTAGGLASSITPSWGGNFAIVGTDKRYAAIHQFGGPAGRGRKVNIPARPFLVIQDEDMTEIKRAILKHLEIKE